MEIDNMKRFNIVFAILIILYLGIWAFIEYYVNRKSLDYEKLIYIGLLVIFSLIGVYYYDTIIPNVLLAIAIFYFAFENFNNPYQFYILGGTFLLGTLLFIFARSKDLKFSKWFYLFLILQIIASLAVIIYYNDRYRQANLYISYILIFTLISALYTIFSSGSKFFDVFLLFLTAVYAGTVIYFNFNGTERWIAGGIYLVPIVLTFIFILVSKSTKKSVKKKNDKKEVKKDGFGKKKETPIAGAPKKQGQKRLPKRRK